MISEIPLIPIPPIPKKLIMSLDAPSSLINEEIQKLLEDGIIFEPRPGKVRLLG
jgi:hypothetical protein